MILSGWQQFISHLYLCSSDSESFVEFAINDRDAILVAFAIPLRIRR